MYQDKKRRLIRMPDSIYPPARLRYSYPGRERRCDLPGTSGGFSLVEIMIVVAIIALVALLAIPMVTSGADVQIRSAANMIAGDLEYAKSMAISRGANYSVVFFENTDSYRIEDQNNNVIPHPVRTRFDYVVDFQNDGRVSKDNIDDVDFNATPRVWFDGLGSPDNGGTVSLEADGITATVAVEPVTGFISIGN